MAEIEPVRGGRFSALQVAGIALAAVLATALLTIWVVRTYLYPSQFKPVRLTAAEQQVLDTKLERLESFGGTRKVRPAPKGDRETLKPERYTETDASREISLSEREINALIASNSDLAPRAAIDLSKNLASAKLLIPMDPDLPVFGGRTLRVDAGVELAFSKGRPVVALRGIKIMGVPIPNAWLGNLKNVDLVEQFGADAGFWKTFAAGIEQMEVEEGRLKIRLRE
jgi:plasmid maintenance system antidote protein VapI